MIIFEIRFYWIGYILTIQNRLRVLFEKTNSLIFRLLVFLFVFDWANIGHVLYLL